MKRIISIITLLTMCVSVSHGAFSSKDIGTATMQFLKIGVGARESSMGGASAGISKDVNSIYYNPAGLNAIENKEASFMHSMWIEEITYDHLAYAQRLKKGGVIGVMINYLTMTGIEKIDNLGNNLNETYKPVDMALTLSYAKKVKDINLGANVKYISSKIEEESASGIALDLGLQKKVIKDKMCIGLAVQNLGTSVKYMSESESLPLNIKLGLGYKHKLKKNKIIAGLDINAPIDEGIKVNLGAEYKHKLSEVLALSPRVGYRTDRTDLEEGTNGITGGFGIKYKGYDIDYCWNPFGELGQAHKISIKAKFGKQTKLF